MIVPMQKYSFLIFHKEYNSFLKEIQEIGVIHIIEKNKNITDEIREQYRLLSNYAKILKFLEKRKQESEKSEIDIDGALILQDIVEKQKKEEFLKQKLISENKELQKTKAWGDFSKQIIEKLKQENIFVRFFISSKKKFDSIQSSKFITEVITETNSTVHFVLIEQTEAKTNIDAEEIQLPKRTFSEIQQSILSIKEEIKIINNDFDNYAKKSIPTIKAITNSITENSDYKKALLNSSIKTEGKLMLLEGFTPQNKEKELIELLNKNHNLYVREKPTTKDEIPVLIKNNKFSRLFEPIGKLFSLPAYSELDLTAFFAPFFMMFFGFCLGDAGYGLIFIIGAGIYKLKAKEDIKPILSLVQFLGLATIIFGTISGTLFGINLIETDIKLFADVKTLFLDPDSMFNLALILGAIQIVFGMIIKMINQIKQFGFKYSLATLGWLIVLVGGTIVAVLSSKEIINTNIFLYIIMSVGGIFILFFSDPKINVFARIGKGLWDIYSTVTGIFGDLLSYIRLFALGLSSAILGFVINDIAVQILGSAPVIGHIFFVIFLLFGHTLNILIASLGSFVHPMRLTFVEFYKNAGFVGGGKEYKPFAKKTIIQ